MATTIASQVQELYVGYLGRAADQEGLDFWTKAITDGTSTIESVAQGFTLSNEYTTQYDGLNTNDLVGKVYENVLGRTADADGLAFWAGEITSGVVTAETLVASIINSLGAIDQQVIDNKVFVANTYTAAAGSSYNPAAGANVIAGVDGTAASVSNALATIESGTLPGSVAGLSVIQGLYTAQQALAGFETSNAAAVDKFVADFKADTNAATTASAGLATNATFSQKLAAAKIDAQAARDVFGADSLTVVTAKAADAQKALDAVVAKLNFAEKDLVSKYNTAVVNDKAATGASDEQAAAAQAGLGVATGFAAALAAAKTAGVTFATDNGAGVWTAYVGTDAVTGGAAAAPASDADRAKIAEAFKDVAFFNSTFKVAADAEHADLKAEVALNTATANLAASTNGSDYIAAATADLAADKKVADVTAADAVKVQVDALAAGYAAANKGVTDFTDATTGKIAKFNVPADVELKDLNGNFTADPAVKETFYFADKIVATDDFAITTFAKGDAIYLGNGIAYNSGALTAGNNSVMEYFLVQDGADAKLVIETAVFGSADTNLTGAIGAEVSLNAAVITLSGVNVADLQVANGAVVFA